MEEFAPAEEALQAAGIPFRRPVDIVEERNLQRRSTMVKCRAQLAKQEDLRFATARKELTVMRTMEAFSRTRTRSL